ncbi:Tetratricopeptide repeat-containing protein [Seinonella peptonophila]|uniref:Tetratricopeptide repeat-containing protein n=1 Tax=Seinonella peptonophila TaxID=112248 RepID=A0A1M4ZS98_9BACL|nr:tetratricopeptide repeat protein [Seinonella peptonophila]SHF20667.1 Tetratricopeptide repeat-containing protein [Seinonella peptonophila]
MIAYYKNSDFDSALNWTKKGIGTFVLDGDRIDHYYYLLLNKAIYLEKMKQNEKALRAVKNLRNKIIQSQQQNSNTHPIRHSVITQMYIVFGNVLNNLGLREEGLEYTKEGIEIAQVNQSYDHLFTLWTTMGIIYYSLGNSEDAEVYYRLALSIEQRVENNNYLSFAYTNLSSLLIKQNKFEQAEKYMKKSLKISQQSDNKLRQTESYSVMGQWYLEQGKY